MNSPSDPSRIPLREPLTIRSDYLPPIGGGFQAAQREALGPGLLECLEESVLREARRNRPQPFKFIAVVLGLATIWWATAPWLFTDEFRRSTAWQVFLLSSIVLIPVITLASSWYYSGTKKRIAQARKRRAIESGRYPLCLHCDYDVSEGKSDHCPECGAPLLLIAPDP